MKTTFVSRLAFAVLSLSATAAYAQPTQMEFTDSTSFVSGKTRAEVRAELAQARAEGSYAQIDGVRPTVMTTAASTARSHVVSDLMHAKVSSRQHVQDPTTM